MRLFSKSNDSTLMEFTLNLIDKKLDESKSRILRLDNKIEKMKLLKESKESYTTIQKNINIILSISANENRILAIAKKK